jgi:hypothetical protein
MTTASPEWTAYYYPNNKSGAWYVSELPGHGGVDWGYTTDASKAVALNDYWWKRFASDRRKCGSVAHCHPAPVAEART